MEGEWLIVLKGRYTGMSKVKRTYKDGVFRRIFNDKEKIIELYNALTGNNYDDNTDVEIITLEDAIFGDIKNDLAFIIDGHYMVMTEHQSTIKPNMPLRMLSYSIREYERQDIMKKLYSRRIVKIPVPELYVLYNGEEEQPIEHEMKLSDAFMVKCDKIAIEARVKVINVNYDKNSELLKRSKTLREYSRFIHMVREKQESMDMEEAVEETIRECLKEGILREFLTKNGGDIMDFVNLELTREECEAIRENDGYERGLEEGMSKGRINEQHKIAKKMKDVGIDELIISKVTQLSCDDIDKL